MSKEIIWSHNDNTNCTFMHLIINIRITSTSSICLSLFKLTFFSLTLRYVIMVKWNIGHLCSSAKKLLVNTSPRTTTTKKVLATQRPEKLEKWSQRCSQTKTAWRQKAKKKKKILTGMGTSTLLPFEFEMHFSSQTCRSRGSGPRCGRARH